MNYQQRVKQRIALFRLGIVMLFVGAVLFLFTISLGILNLPYQYITELLILSQCLIGAGVLWSVIFARVGWYRSLLADLLLNQLSLICTIIGLTGIAYTVLSRKEGTTLTLLFLLITIVGIIVAVLGIKFSTYPYHNEKDEK